MKVKLSVFLSISTLILRESLTTYQVLTNFVLTPVLDNFLIPIRQNIKSAVDTMPLFNLKFGITL